MSVTWRNLAGTCLRIEEGIAMRDVGEADHAVEDRTQTRVGKHLLCEDDEGIVHIVLWYGSGDSVQVSRSHVQIGPQPRLQGIHLACVLGKPDHEETTIRRQSAA